MTESSQSSRFPSRRVVLLGASNLKRGFSTVVETACQAWGRPLDFVAALGHGRSYSPFESRVLMRVLPGILSCGIWQAIAERPRIPTATLLTDIGNDLLYGRTVDQIADWVDQCLQNVAEFSKKIVITGLPVDRIKRLRKWQFVMLRSLLFPSSRLKFRDAIEGIMQLNKKILELSDHYNATIIRPRDEWYGMDPIHIKPSERRKAWHEIMSAWREKDATKIDCAPSIKRWLRLCMIRPHQRRLFGITQRKSQPAAHFSDGTHISIY